MKKIIPTDAEFATMILDELYLAKGITAKKKITTKELAPLVKVLVSKLVNEDLGYAILKKKKNPILLLERPDVTLNMFERDDFAELIKNVKKDPWLKEEAKMLKEIINKKGNKIKEAYERIHAMDDMILGLFLETDKFKKFVEDSVSDRPTSAKEFTLTEALALGEILAVLTKRVKAIIKSKGVN